ncbi:diacylglycerol/lipid kinase family protein [Bosea eneae]|uniref:Diacylglycerol/lipid kinase family protein n=1 Tax=Bosea eneae TaxID=151454 RepID=A0ABW0J0L9_9HYPH
MTTSHSAQHPAFDRRVEKAALAQEIKESRRAVLVVNTRSRRGARAYSEAKRRLIEAGIILDASYPVRHSERLPEIVREEIAKGRKFIIVGGGDGTISSVVDHFAYVSVVLGVLPLGTANSFARTLGIPLDLPGAIDILVSGKVFDVDLGKINDGYFANGSSIGMPAVIGRATPHALKKWLGRGAYLLVGASKFMRYGPFRCIITINGEETSFDALDVRIANGGYQGGVLVAPDANPDDGQIVVHILTEPSKWALGKEWARVALRAPFRAADIEVLKAPELVIDTVPKQDVAVDGEVITKTPIRVSVGREALIVMVPPAFVERVDPGSEGTSQGTMT